MLLLIDPRQFLFDGGSPVLVGQRIVQLLAAVLCQTLQLLPVGRQLVLAPLDVTRANIGLVQQLVGQLLV